MSEIRVLDQTTIDKIAAGEVVERPASVVKELTENAIDAGADRISVDIKDGGIRMIRITDNGGGIPADQVRKAFLRHATSKITAVEDLQTLKSLGFRGEALSSIAAVSRVELITKEADSLEATRYCIEGGRERLLEEVGAPDGTTIVVRDLFYNTPARAKFLKTAMTEAARVGAFVEQLALANPEIGFRFIVNGQTRLATTGSGSLKDAIYNIYGRDVAAELVAIDYEENGIQIGGFIARPAVSRGNRNFENYYVNGRYVKSRVVSIGIEEGYGTHLMQHQYPFTCLRIDLPGDGVDVNVHPTKMEVRFSDEKAVMNAVSHAISRALAQEEMILRTSLNPPEKPAKQEKAPEKYASPEIFERGAGWPAASVPGNEDRQESGSRADYSNRDGQRFTFPARQAANVSGSEDRPAEQEGSNNTNAPGSDGQRYTYSARTPGTTTLREQMAMNYARRLEKLAASGDENDTTVSGAEPGYRKAAVAPAGGTEEVRGDAAGIRPDGGTSSDVPGSGPAEEEQAPVSGTWNGDLSDPAGKASAGTASASGTAPDTGKTSVGKAPTLQQLSFLPDFLSPEAAPLRRIIGCAFDTYWILEYGDKLYMIDQHAAHEKVLFTRFWKMYEDNKLTGQIVSPPVVISLSMEEQVLLEQYMEAFRRVGFEIEPFGGRDYKISAVPYTLSGMGARELFLELLGNLEVSDRFEDLDRYVLKVATEACKAAVKGGDRLSLKEAEALIDELFACGDPYHCPHGRPTIISFTRADLEKRFRRIV